MTHIDEKRCNSCEMGWHDDCDTSGESFVCRCSVCAREAERIQGLIDSSERATASALDLEAIRKLIPGERWHAKGTMLDEIVIQSESDPRVGTFDRWQDADTAAKAVNALGPLCAEVERLTKDRDHWQANHDEMKARNDVLRDRLDLDAEKVKPRLALLDRYDALVAENAKLREVVQLAIKLADEARRVVGEHYGVPEHTVIGAEFRRLSDALDDFNQHYALADLALRGGGG